MLKNGYNLKILRCSHRKIKVCMAIFQYYERKCLQKKLFGKFRKFFKKTPAPKPTAFNFYKGRP